MKKENGNSVRKHNLKAVKDMKNLVFGVCPQLRGANNIFLLQIGEVQRLDSVFCLWRGRKLLFLAAN